MTDDPFLCIALLAGLILGSFATALVHRLPRGISMVTRTRSSCTSCARTLGLADLVPVFSWLWLRGRCRSCRAKIHWKYPVIELSTAALCAAFYAAYGLSPQLLPLFALAPALVAAAAIDLEHKILPDVLNLAALLCGVSAWALGGADLAAGAEAALAAALYAGFALLLRRGFASLGKGEAMGLGDVKFFGAAGFWLGLDAGAAAGFLILSGGSGILLALAWKKMTGEERFPFGPALVLALAAMILLAKPFA